jgi:hypothetical protein
MRNKIHQMLQYIFHNSCYIDSKYWVLKHCKHHSWKDNYQCKFLNIRIYYHQDMRCNHLSWGRHRSDSLPSTSCRYEYLKSYANN